MDQQDGSPANINSDASGSGDRVDPGLNNGQQIGSSTFHKLPPFWSSMPEAWFLQAENIFRINRMHNDMNMFQHIIAMLPQDIVGSVIDLLRNPPVNNKYETLKNALIARHTISEEKRLEQLLQPSEIGDRKPSSFFRDMEASMGPSNFINPDLLKKLWIRKLPEKIRIAVTSSGKEEIEELTNIADKVWEVMQHQTVYSLSSVQNESKLQLEIASAIASLSLEVKNLKNEVTALQENFNRSFDAPRRTFQFRSRSRSRSRSATPRRTPDGICWYHKNFGDKATKCLLPCNYQKSKDSLNG